MTRTKTTNVDDEEKDNNMTWMERLEGQDAVGQWDELIFETYETNKDDGNYRSMTYNAFKTVVHSVKDDATKTAKVPDGFDWTKDFETPIFEQFIALVSYYFIMFVTVNLYS